MKSFLITALFLFFAMPAHSSNEIPANIKEPKYSDIKKMSNVEIYHALTEYVGTEDSWRKQSPVIKKIKSFIPFQKKTELKDELVQLSFIHAKKSSNSLKEYVLTAQRSQHAQIPSTIAIVRGDKKLALDAFREHPGHSSLTGLLYFFRTLDYGDTGLENKKFTEFVYGFSNLARSIRTAYEASAALQMPMILEFESSAFNKKSPLTRLFYNTLINHPEQVLKVEATPDAGRLVSIHPFYAKKVAENIELFSEQFNKRVKFARYKLTSDRTIRQSLVDLIRYGEGMGGFFYTDEKIVEVVLNKNNFKNPTCSQLFN